MDDKSQARLEAFVRSVTFAHDHASDVENTDAPVHVRNLEEINAKLVQARAGQAGASAVAREVLIDSLLIDVRNASRTAAAIGQDVPGFEKLFRSPAHNNPTEVCNAADAYIANLADSPTDDAETKTAKAQRRAKFIGKGMPEDFPADLVNARRGIDEAKVAESKGDNASVQNTALIGQLISAGLKERAYLNAIFHNVYTHNPDKLRAWMSAMHIERAPQHKKNGDGQTPEPAVPESQLATEPSAVPSK